MGDNDKIILCNNCTYLEKWQSNAHDVKHNACTKRKLLNPKEEECNSFKMNGEKIDYICRKCKLMEVWTSSDKGITSEVCSIRHLILPIEEECNFFKG